MFEVEVTRAYILEYYSIFERKLKVVDIWTTDNPILNYKL